MAGTILIVEDEALLARNMARFLERRGFETTTAGSLRQGIAVYEEIRPEIVFADHNLPDGDGIALIRHIRQCDACVKIVMITAHGSVATAVAAMKSGADDYLTKPVSLEELGLLAERLLSHSQLENSLSYYRRKDEGRGGLARILGESDVIVAMKQRIAQILAMEERRQDGPSPPVLITGETGTGKELVARALHFDGPRRAGPFVEINCAALPAHLVESELFGHERGAFTDAKERRVGLIQSADHGTLFLDEVGELPLAAQAKLLKVIEDHKVRPIGGTRERSVDVRFVAATNVAIEDRAHAGEFRPDLYYRLGALTIVIPPLRTRGEDVLLLAEHFLAEHRRRYERPRLRLEPDAESVLRSHPWAGNVRELHNVLEQAALLTVGERIGVADLNLREPPSLDGARAVSGTQETLSGVEYDFIVQALRRAGGNVTLAAQALGITRDALRYRMDKHELRREEFIQ
jgi:two-component system, NtrC family, response regulator AtoC